MARKTLQRPYADGVMYLYMRSGQSNPRTVSDLIPDGKLCFDYRNIRQEDYEFAEQMDKHLTVKVSAPLRKDITTNHLAIIDNVLYAIIQIDPDRAAKEMFFYLTEVRKIA